MNEITIHGHIGQSPRIRHTSTGKPVVSFSVAVSSGYYDRSRGQWISKPTVWHNVVVYNELADNTYDTLTNSGKGTLVTVTGKFADDSWTREGRGDEEDIVIRRLKFEASDVAVSLAKATVTVTRNEPKAESQPTPTAAATDSETAGADAA